MIPTQDNLCDVPGVLVGHATDPIGLTGCTAILFERPAIVSVDVRGSSPGTRETDRLSPAGSVRETHALLLTGGSAFGLAAADGVVRYLEEQGIGLDIGVARIPLVSAAVLFDLMTGSPDARPDADMGYHAAQMAESGNFPQGTVGAATGATVGKILGLDGAMKGGIGSASVQLDDGLVVSALVAVNAFGDIKADDGSTLAGPRVNDETLGDTADLLQDAATRMRWGRNTTLGVVATNASLSKTEVYKVAQMAHDGFARCIEPVHTTVDGDVIFSASAGDVSAAVDVVGVWGARMMKKSVLRAIRAATGVESIPSATEFHGE